VVSDKFVTLHFQSHNRPSGLDEKTETRASTSKPATGSKRKQRLTMAISASRKNGLLLLALLLFTQTLSFEVASEDFLMGTELSLPASPNVNVANPYVSGCLYHHNLTLQIRVCNSDDSADIVAAGLCREPPVPQYHDPEIRLLVQNWETAAFTTWIMQFILSELLDVPVSIEDGAAGALNFYNPLDKFEMGRVLPEYKIAFWRMPTI
jgi:hypothetical protein